MRTALRLLLVIAVGVSAAACGEGEGATPQTRPSTSVPSPAASMPSPSTADSDGTRIVDAEETVFFTSPSGNILCSMARANAVCEISGATFEPPERPADCELDHGTMVAVQGPESAEFLCHGDTGFGSAASTLEYGQSISNGLVSCTSAETGMACRNAEATHGFELARAAYRVY